VDGPSGSAVIGTLEWIAAKIDPRTRMISARAELPNPDGKLRDGMFVRCRILTGGAERSTLVPSSSIQEIEGKTFVFVRIEGDLYEARRVELGTRYNGEVEILAGLDQEDEVAVEHTFLVKSQFLLSRLGAGCVD
jgi:cobalt-zinc-cadmium efflux system membrane fusion protein